MDHPIEIPGGQPSDDGEMPRTPRETHDMKFPSFATSAEGGSLQSIDLLKDVPLRVTVELGRAQLLVKDVLGLRTGSVVELDRQAGAAVDILVNGVLIARGEVVVVDERFGVRISEVIGWRNGTPGDGILTA